MFFCKIKCCALPPLAWPANQATGKAKVIQAAVIASTKIHRALKTEKTPRPVTVKREQKTLRRTSRLGVILTEIALVPYFDSSACLDEAIQRFLQKSLLPSNQPFGESVDKGSLMAWGENDKTWSI